MKQYFTTPIYYVNDVPHIGHAYCTLATDTLARYWRQKLGPDQVFFLTGVDENSQKTVDAAKKQGKDVTVYLHEMANTWRTTWEQIGISFDDFIRTTEDRHIKEVHRVFNLIQNNDDFYLGKYEGLYCSGCEAFLKESDLDENGDCPDHQSPPEKIVEDNYFFRLSKYEQPLLDFFDTHPDFLLPQSRRREVVNFIKNGLEDISISRETAEFGIPLPLNEKHKIYVWFDALINYLSGDRERAFWPATHIIGKDISRFHAVIWPAMLMSAGIDLPKQIYAHGFFTVDGVKMSKSLGNVVSPLDLAQEYGNDALRLGLLSGFEFGGDGDFSLAHFSDFYRMRLAGGVGNLFNRVIVLIHKFLDGKRPPEDVQVKSPLPDFSKALESFRIREAVDIYFKTVDEANLLLNETQVWTLAKTHPDKARVIFAQLLAQLDYLAQMSEVLLPFSVDKMKQMLGSDTHVGEAVILFDRK